MEDRLKIELGLKPNRFIVNIARIDLSAPVSGA